MNNAGYIMRLIGKARSRGRQATGKIMITYSRLVRKFGHTTYKVSMVHAANLSDIHLPLPQLKISGGHPMSAGKGRTSYKKWGLIENTMPDRIYSALDIGCYNGFFSLNLAAKGVFVIGIEPNKDLLRLAQLGAVENNIGHVAFALMAIDPDSVRCLPGVDLTLALSVMHYWIQTYGWKTAVEMLSVIWEKTRVCLYFETPNPCDNEKMAPYLSVMGSTEAECRHFIHEMLASLGSCEVVFLDYLPTDFRGGNERRHIFMVKRKAASGGG